MALRLRISKSFSRAGYDVWFFQDAGGGYRVAKPANLEFGELISDSCYLLPEPTFFIRQHEWNELADAIKSELVTNGFQPKADVLEGELKATKFHLEDMRTLVLKDKKK